MTKIGLFFGTQTGNTETIAETIQKLYRTSEESKGVRSRDQSSCSTSVSLV